MKISDITLSDVLAYLRIESDQCDIGTITTIMSAAKAYIISYTGLCDKVVTGEVIGTGDGSTVEYNTIYSPIVTIKVYVNSVLKTENADYTVDYPTGFITFATAPASDLSVTVDYTAGIDAFEDFAIAYYVLCQDMYDNRSMYVEKTNVNKVVESILGMHCVNLI